MKPLIGITLLIALAGWNKVAAAWGRYEDLKGGRRYRQITREELDEIEGRDQ